MFATAKPAAVAIEKIKPAPIEAGSELSVCSIVLVNPSLLFLVRFQIAIEIFKEFRPVPLKCFFIVSGEIFHRETMNGS